MSRLCIRGNQFYFKDKPIQILSGAIHYFRIVPEYWEDRLLKLKACGFNTVETYVPWNLHEPHKGSFYFDGLANVENFIKVAEKLGLYVIIRPSPYICGEWDYGGLPAWLLADRNLRIRSLDTAYLSHVDDYYDVLMSKLRPFLSTNDGPIIAMQIENEYGSYGNDKQYLHYLKQAIRNRGIDILLFTSDGPTDSMLQGGMVEGELATVNFGTQPKKAFKKLQTYRPGDPLFCMEYWNGWFDHWGEDHHERGFDDTVTTFSQMLEMGASVNFYMFHGGTNFGFFNGANFNGEHQPAVTSYDYDAPLNESGDITPKYHAVRKAVAQHLDLDMNEVNLPESIAKKNYGPVTLHKKVGLFSILDTISEPLQRTHPETMERVGQNFGFILYRTMVNSGTRENVGLYLQDVHDRALIFVNGDYLGVIDRWHDTKISFDIPERGVQLDILVENMGRINYGPSIGEEKGITEGIRLDQQFIFDWTIYPLPLADVNAISYDDTTTMEGPAFYKGIFEVDEIGDTFLELPGWTKGVAYVNGFNLGRYWHVGPQKTLYVPGPLLQKGKNELVLFELHGTAHEVAYLKDKESLG